MEEKEAGCVSLHEAIRGSDRPGPKCAAGADFESGVKVRIIKDLFAIVNLRRVLRLAGGCC